MKTIWKTTLATLALGLVLTLAGAGCDIYDYCKEATDCLGGNRRDEQACRTTLRGNRAVATRYGCRSEWVEYMDCLERKSYCMGGYYTDNDLCSRLSQTYANCVDDASNYQL